MVRAARGRHRQSCRHGHRAARRDRPDNATLAVCAAADDTAQRHAGARPRTARHAAARRYRAGAVQPRCPCPAATAGRRGRGERAPRRPDDAARFGRCRRPDADLQRLWRLGRARSRLCPNRRCRCLVHRPPAQRPARRPAHAGRSRGGSGHRRGLRGAADRRFLRVRDRHRGLYAVGHRAGRRGGTGRDPDGASSRLDALSDCVQHGRAGAHRRLSGLRQPRCRLRSARHRTDARCRAGRDRDPPGTAAGLVAAGDRRSSADPDRDAVAAGAVGGARGAQPRPRDRRDAGVHSRRDPCREESRIDRFALGFGFRGGLFFASLFLGSLVGHAFADVINRAERVSSSSIRRVRHWSAWRHSPSPWSAVR